MLAVIIAAFSFKLEWQAVLLAVLISVTLVSRHRRQIYRGFMKFVFPLIVIGFAINGMFFTGDVAFSLGPIAFKEQGLIFAATVSVRLMLIVISIGYFFSKVESETLAEYMVSSGADRRLVYIYLLSIAMVHLMKDKLGKIFVAQSARGLDPTRDLSARAKYILPLLVPLAYSYLAESLDRGMALNAAHLDTHMRTRNAGASTSTLLVIETNIPGLITGRLLLAATIVFGIFELLG